MLIKISHLITKKKDFDLTQQYYNCDNMEETVHGLILKLIQQKIAITKTNSDDTEGYFLVKRKRWFFTSIIKHITIQQTIWWYV